jgi:hypothetical protein
VRVVKSSKKETFSKKWLKTFSKKAVFVILAISLIDLQLSYILAFLGREQIAEALSSEIATVIVGVMLGYFMKALFETFFEKREERLAGHFSVEEEQEQ